nr:MAG TPA: hypothetical protein [Caudoviricetes sp.]DAK16476.1 MAG TPA: hypothetical protein [Caudoviricetes sp.]DAO66400.1 MAG TPA: hypothetical protein [Caudoviricetes sp.]
MRYKKSRVLPKSPPTRDQLQKSILKLITAKIQLN